MSVDEDLARRAPVGDALRESLLRAGVAPKYVRRAVAEIECHFEQLLDDVLQRGEHETVAFEEARACIGAEEMIVRRYAERPELLAWSRRWTAAWFVGVPLLVFAAAGAVIMTSLCLGAGLWAAHLHQTRVSASAADRMQLAARILILWMFPLVTCGGFAVLAYRRRVAQTWPIAGIVCLCTLASLMNVEFQPDQFGAGIGTSVATFVGQIMHAALIAMAVLGPLMIAMRNFKQRRAAPE